MLTLLQPGKSHPQPIVCLQAPGCDYWHRWYDFITGQLLSRRLISEEDLSLFKIFDSAEAAVHEIESFYRTYHSSRFVHHHLVMRLKHALAEDQVEALKTEFADMLVDGTISQRHPFPEEQNEPALHNFPRLVLHYNRRSAVLLRQLIDRVNGFPLPAGLATAGAVTPPAGL